MNSTGEPWRLGHTPALDGVRAIAVGLVLLTHAGAPYSGQLGAVGVTMFFTLSGFLITSLLLQERDRIGSFRIPAFYLRRALRLAPALLACVVLAVGAEWAVLGEVADWSLALGALTWTTNFVMMDGGWAATPLEHTWSLAIEEQFYLLWPLALLALVRIPRRTAAIVVAYLCAGALVLRAAVYDPANTLGHAYLGLDTRADQLLIGAGLAIALSGSRVRHIDPRWAGVLLVVIVALGVVHHQMTYVLLSTVVAGLTAVVLYVVTHSRVGLLERPAMVWLGQRSYGVYLYHVPIQFALAAALPDGTPWWLSGAGMVGATVVVAAASFRWVETPFLDLKERFGSGDPGHGAKELERHDALDGSAPRR